MATRKSIRVPDWKNVAVAVLVPAVFFAALEFVLALAGVHPVLYDEDPYVGFAANVPLFAPAKDPDFLETAPNKLRLFNYQRFARIKPGGHYRIFCIGGSTTYGRPYDDHTSFCGWLRELLPAIDPSKSWEVINAGGISYASYRSALLMEELIGYQPDLFIIYSGHNEFLEERTYSGLIAMPESIRGFAALASRSRTYSALRSVLRRLKRLGESTPAGGTRPSQLASEVRTRLDDTVGPDAYVRDDPFQAQVLEHFRFNLARMADIADSVGASSLLVTPASNLRQCSPFKSQERPDLTSSERERWRALLDRAELAKSESRLDEALIAVDEALTIDPRHADAIYLRAQILDRLGRYTEARSAFESARDEDVCPLRALGPTSAIVREVAASRALALVDFARWVDSEAHQGIPGEDLFLDHVHPTIETHRQLALLLAESLMEQGVVARPAAFPTAAIERVRLRVEAGLDHEAHGRALLNLSKVYGWAGKLEDASRLAERAVTTSPELPEAHYQAGLTAQLTDRLDVAIIHYRRSLELAPDIAVTHGNLAAALEKKGNTLQAILHYRRAIALLGDQQSPYKTQLIETLAHLGATPD